MKEAGTGRGVTSTAPKVSLVKTARRCVLFAKTDTTVTPFMASALTATLAGLETGEKGHTAQSILVLLSQSLSWIFIILKPY